MSFRRVLRPFDATMVVIGGIIGSGIFINPRLVAQSLDSTVLVLAAWMVGGLVALCGAFAYAELGARFPKAGGQYVYLRDAWHPLAGFLYVWALLLIIETGAMAAVAIIFAEYLLRFLGRDTALALPLAVSALAIVSAVNYFGVKPGSRVLNLFVVLKVAALGVLIGIGLLLPTESAGWFSDTRATELTTGTGPGTGFGTVVAFGAALIPILFAYGGWQNANYIAEEIEAPERNLPRSLIIGVIVVAAVYVLVNVAYLRLLGLEGLAATATPAADAAARALGTGGDKFVAAAIAISTFGFLDLAVLAPTRVYYAAAADGYLPAALARLHPKYGTPALAIVIQAIWAVMFVVTGTYGDLLDSVVFADWIFFGATVAALFVWRKHAPATPTYRTPGYPILPAFFVFVAIAVVISVIIKAPMRAGAGALLIATGIPVFYYFSRRRGKRL